MGLIKGLNISVCHEKNVLSRYKVGLISYHDKPVIRDFRGQGAHNPENDKDVDEVMEITIHSRLLEKKIFSKPVSKM